MSVIQSIRDKAAWIIIAAIALALIAFIVQDAFQGGGRGLFGGNSTTLGKINGTTVDYLSFEERYKMAEANYQQNSSVDESLRQRIRESLWNEYVEDAVLGDEYKKIGFAAIGKDERGDILYGPNAPDQLSQQFTDPKTGMYDPNAAYQAISSMRKNTAQYNSFWGEFVPALEKARLKEKFVALIGNSAYTPKWLLERSNVENSQLSNISYVNIPYTIIPDSTLKVTDEEIRQYVNENKEAYQQEESRGIEYVSFDAAPTAGDSAKILEDMNAHREEFANASSADVEGFLVRNNSETPFYDGYVLGSNMRMQNADTLKQLADGAVYGPYIDGDNYVLAKMVGRRSLPDSARTRHILIKIADGRSGQVRTDSAAKKLIDSIVTAIQSGGASFESMVAKYSDDDGSKATNGEYTFPSSQFSSLSREFAETAFYGNVGDKKTVKVENASYSGYHYIEVLSHKNIGIAYKIAYLSRSIVPSDITVNKASSLAAQFAAESRTKKQFDDNAKKQNLNKFPAMEIKPLDGGIPGLGENRELVRWMYRDAKPGVVAQQAFQVGDKFIVPVLVVAYEKGNMAVEKARPLVEYKLRNNKKVDAIIKKIGNASTLEAIAQATAQTVQQADSISFRTPFIPNVGNEPKVVGAAFNKDFQNKISGPITGEMGMFYLKVNSLSAVPNPNFDVKQMQQAMRQQQQQQMVGYRVIDAIKKTADITDNRVKFF